MRRYTHLGRLHVEHFGDPPLHDEEVRVVHIELDGPEEVLDPGGRGIAAVDQILVPTSNHNL